MKRCPKCNADYFDNMLEFCLEDGTRLLFATQTAVAVPTLQQPATTLQSEPMLHSPSSETVVMQKQGGLETAGDKMAKDQISAPNAESQTAKILETAPIVLALLHNWWQWVYLEKAPVYSITDFIVSANFLMWLLLLASGAAVSLLAVKHSKNKTLGIISLVALAINLILFLVPRR